MNAIDRLALRWQFESFKPDAQEASYKYMVQEFAVAWRMKRNRAYIQMRIKRLDKCRPDLKIKDRFINLICTLKNKGMGMIDFHRDWSKFDARKTKKEVYIGPEAYRQM